MSTLRIRLKRKRDDSDSDLSEEEIESQFQSQRAAKKQRKPYRPLLKYLQLLYAQLRDTDDDFEKAFLEEEIHEYETELEKYNVSTHDHSMFPIDDDGGEPSATGKKVSFGIPKMAFYTVDSIRRKSPIHRHSSLEEISRHQHEIQKAMENARENPIWYSGGSGRRNTHICNKCIFK